MGAAIPIVAWVGIRPIPTVEIAFKITDKTRAFFLPFISPIRPNIIAPMGRIKNPAAKTPNTAISAAVLSSVGKNNGAIVFAINPYTAKSYHSMIFPTEPDRSIRMSDLVLDC